MTNANPSLNPADNDSLTGVFRNTVYKMMQSYAGALPAKVIAYDIDSNRAQVQPLIKISSTSGDAISRAQVASVPVVQIGGSGYVINIPLQTGDFGLLIACDRDISLFLQGYTESAPNTARIKDFADSYFIPTVLKNVIIASEDRENIVIQNNSGSIKIALHIDKVKIVAPRLAVEGNITASGTITPGVPA